HPSLVDELLRVLPDGREGGTVRGIARAGHEVGEVRVAGHALALALPLERDVVHELPAALQGEFLSDRFLGGIGADVGRILACAERRRSREGKREEASDERHAYPTRERLLEQKIIRGH